MQIASISLTAIQSLSGRQLENLTTSEIGEFTAAQIGALTTGQIASMSSGDMLALTGAHGGVLTRSQIQSLSTGGVQTLSETQIQGFGVAQTRGAQRVVPDVDPSRGAGRRDDWKPHRRAIWRERRQEPRRDRDRGDRRDYARAVQFVDDFTAGVAIDRAKRGAGGAGPGRGRYRGICEPGLDNLHGHAVTFLQSAAAGGMTTAKFGALQDIANDLNVKGGLTTSAYVEQMTDNVVEGDSANADWNGGSSTAAALGDLTANSTATQANELIGKWFLGTDLPAAGSGCASAYQASTPPALRRQRRADRRRRHPGQSGRRILAVVARRRRDAEPVGDRIDDIEQWERLLFGRLRRQRRGTTTSP